MDSALDARRYIVMGLMETDLRNAVKKTGLDAAQTCHIACRPGKGHLEGVALEGGQGVSGTF